MQICPEEEYSTVVEMLAFEVGIEKNQEYQPTKRIPESRQLYIFCNITVMMLHQILETLDQCSNMTLYDVQLETVV